MVHVVHSGNVVHLGKWYTRGNISIMKRYFINNAVADNLTRQNKYTQINEHAIVSNQ